MLEDFTEEEIEFLEEQRRYASTEYKDSMFEVIIEKIRERIR
jgi:hypothetical protein